MTSVTLERVTSRGKSRFGAAGNIKVRSAAAAAPDFSYEEPVALAAMAAVLVLGIRGSAAIRRLVYSC